MPGTPNSGGRNKKGAQTHIVRGTFRGDRHADQAAPEPPKGRPVPPRPLEGEALEEWDRMIARLEKSGTLSVVDDAALYQYARLFEETEELAHDKANAKASVVILEANIRGMEGADLVAVFQEISKLRRLEATYSTQIRQGRMAIRQYLVEFGQTPAARQRVKVAPTKPQSKAEQFRQQKGA